MRDLEAQPADHARDEVVKPACQAGKEVDSHRIEERHEEQDGEMLARQMNREGPRRAGQRPGCGHNGDEPHQRGDLRGLFRVDGCNVRCLSRSPNFALPLCEDRLWQAALMRVSLPFVTDETRI